MSLVMSTASSTQLVEACGAKLRDVLRVYWVPVALAWWSYVRHARADTRIQGVVPMAKVGWLLPWPSASNQRADVSSAASDRSVPVRSGEIGPIRREIIFEPVHEKSVPVEPAPVTLETEPKEPMPNRP
jgi:hypothetical protein